MNETAPRYNEEAEMAVIGATMLSAKAVERLTARLRPEHFFLNSHRRLWKAIQNLAAKGTAVDLVTMRDELGSDVLEAIGGVHYLVRLVDDVISAQSAEDYAKIVIERYVRRELIERAENLANSASTSVDLETILSSAGELTRGLHIGTPPVVDASDVVDELSKGEAITGLSTGIPEIDELRLGGLPKAEVSVFGGETGAGKTLLGTQIACHDLEQHRNVLFVSLEMTALQLIQRVMKQLSGYWSESHAISDGNAQAWRDALVTLHQGRLMIYDSSLASNPTAESILDWMLTEHERFPVDRVIVDYAQKLTLRDGGRLETYESHRRISELFRRFAKRHGIPLLMLSQINRNGNDITLRGSREYENDSAFTMMLLRGDATDQNERKISIIKNRHGERRSWEARVNQKTLRVERY